MSRAAIAQALWSQTLWSQALWSRWAIAGALALLLPASPARAQEVQTILAQPVWWVAGVCVGVDQCGFCQASAGSAADGDIALHVSSDEEVSVTAENKTGAGATLVVGTRNFALAGPEDERFSAAKADAAGIIDALQHAPEATLHFAGDADDATYRYDLAEFPKAYAAMLKACRRP